jgi:hypothetical protein
MEADLSTFLRGIPLCGKARFDDEKFKKDLTLKKVFDIIMSARWYGSVGRAHPW